MYVTPPGIPRKKGLETPFEQTFQPMVFRHLFNDVTGISSYVAGCVPGFGKMARDFMMELGADEYTNFIPYFSIADDGMVSKSARSWCRAMGDALGGKDLAFDIHYLTSADQGYEMLVKHFNAEAENVLAIADALQLGGRF
jgi:hypothetical protein